MLFSLFRERAAVYSPRRDISRNRPERKMHARADACRQTAASWPEDIFAILQRFDVRQVPYVPDAGHSQLIERVLGSSIDARRFR